MIFLLACCLAVGKRRDDPLLGVDKETLRLAHKGYTLPFIDTCLVKLRVTTIACYIMYTVRRAKERCPDYDTFERPAHTINDRSVVRRLSDNPLRLINQLHFGAGSRKLENLWKSEIRFSGS